MTKPETATVWDSRAPTFALPGGAPWIVHTADPLLLNAVLQRCLAQDSRLLLAHDHWSEEKVDELARQHEVVGILRGTAAQPVWRKIPGAGQTGKIQTGTGGLGIFTSGTTGEPKLALHTWTSIRQPGKFAAQRMPACRWLMTYNMTTYAGLQVFFAALATSGSIVYPTGGVSDAAQAIIEKNVEAISATPTWWRMLLAAMPVDLRVPSLVQASLGGERVDQAVLDAVRARFRPRRLTHIYASTEAGTSIVVSDDREGFPAAWLDNEERTVRLRIRDGLLEIASPYRMQGYAGKPTATAQPEEWYRTPDLVEQRGERVHFLGRADTVANIGGAKVVLEEVEQQILGLGWFTDCRVYVRPSSVTGAILCAEIVFAAGHKEDIARIKQTLAGRLPRHAQPQLVKIVPTIQLSANGKKLRN